MSKQVYVVQMMKTWPLQKYWSPNATLCRTMGASPAAATVRVRERAVPSGGMLTTKVPAALAMELLAAEPDTETVTFAPARAQPHTS